MTWIYAYFILTIVTFVVIVKFDLLRELYEEVGIEILDEMETKLEKDYFHSILQKEYSYNTVVFINATLISLFSPLIISVFILLFMLFKLSLRRNK